MIASVYPGKRGWGFPKLAIVKGYLICLLFPFGVEMIGGFGKRNTLVQSQVYWYVEPTNFAM
jgi:hypothetical protein